MGGLQGRPATIVLEDNRLSISAGNETIGDWDLSEIRLERVGNGYRMAAEGEYLLIEFLHPDKFADELASSSKRSRIARSRIARSRIAMPDNKALLRGQEALLRVVDGAIEIAEDRVGDLLPAWVFTRLMVGLVAGSLILMLILPGLVSLFLLIAGVSTILLGAIAYADSGLATKWLPGRTTPVHVLLFGMVILLLGIVLGVIAS